MKQRGRALTLPKCPVGEKTHGRQKKGRNPSVTGVPDEKTAKRRHSAGRAVMGPRLQAERDCGQPRAPLTCTRQRRFPTLLTRHHHPLGLPPQVTREPGGERISASHVRPWAGLGVPSASEQRATMFTEQGVSGISRSKCTVRVFPGTTIWRGGHTRFCLTTAQMLTESFISQHHNIYSKRLSPAQQKPPSVPPHESCPSHTVKGNLSSEISSPKKLVHT